MNWAWLKPVAIWIVKRLAEDAVAEVVKKAKPEAQKLADCPPAEQK